LTTAIRLDLYNTSGAKQAELIGSAQADTSGQKAGFRSLSYTLKVNHPGLVIFSLRGDHELLSTLADKWHVEVWRKPEGQAWAREITGIFRQPNWTWGSTSVFVGMCPGLMSLLEGRIVNFPAGTANKTVFSNVKAETVCNTLVKYNGTADATTGNGRKRNGAITGLTVEADGAEGNSIYWYCAQANLLETLQEIAQIGGGDFDVVKTSPTAWQWRWYTGQLGTDRTATLKFSMDLGNMANPEYQILRIQEKTVACVWGQGEDSTREYVTRTGANYVATDNDFEVYINASDIDFGDTGGLNSRGDQAMEELQARNVFRFNAIQAPSTQYGVHYFLGDLVTAINPFTGASSTCKVDQVTVTFGNDGNEQIDVEMVET